MLWAVCKLCYPHATGYDGVLVWLYGGFARLAFAMGMLDVHDPRGAR